MTKGKTSGLSGENNDGIEVDDITLTEEEEVKRDIREIRDKLDKSGIGNPAWQSRIKKLDDFLDADYSGIRGKKQLTNTVRKLMDQTTQSALLIKNIIDGKDVAVNAERAILDIGGSFIGSLIPPPYGDAVASICGMISTLLEITNEKREPSLKEEIANLLREFKYEDLKADYEVQLAKLRETAALISGYIGHNDLPHRTPTIMEHVIALLNDKFEITLKSWSESESFDLIFYENDLWMNKAAAMGRSKIINLAFGYICAKKVWLQSLIILLVRTKDQMKEKNSGAKAIGPIDVHLQAARNAFHGLDETLRSLVEGIFNTAATRQTVVLHATLQALPAFGKMREAYRTLTGTDPAYPQPDFKRTDKVRFKPHQSETAFGQANPRLLDLALSGKNPAGYKEKLEETRSANFRLLPDPKYPGCFYLVGENGHLWKEEEGAPFPSPNRLSDTPRKDLEKLDDDKKRFIFIGLKEKGWETWYYITTRSSVMDASAELSTFHQVLGRRDGVTDELDTKDRAASSHYVVTLVP